MTLGLAGAGGKQALGEASVSQAIFLTPENRVDGLILYNESNIGKYSITIAWDSLAAEWPISSLSWRRVG